MRVTACLLSLPIFSAALLGCASSSQVYLPDGRQGYALNCSGTARSWGACFQKAGEICQSRGYDTYMRDSTQGWVASNVSSANWSSMGGSANSTGFGGTTITREMMIACK